MTTEADFLYEASDEASENELLDKSLSCWKGWSSLKGHQEAFAPLPVDIHTAASLGQYDAVWAFIRGEEDLNRKNLGGWTPLMYASYIGHDNVVNLLLESSRVSVHSKNNRGQTPLMLAASCGNESVCYFLLLQSADIEAKDNKGWTTLFHATYAGHQNVVKFLLENGADKEVREPKKGYTPLMWAAYEGHEIIVQYFLQFGANANVRAKDGNTARCLAMLSGFTKIVGLIDNHLHQGISLRSEPGLGTEADLSSSDESFHNPRPQNTRPNRSKVKGPSISEGPAALARLIGPSNPSNIPSQTPSADIVPQGYVTFEQASDPSGELRFRDFTSPINPDDYLDSSSRQVFSPSLESRDSVEADEEDNAFTLTGVSTVISSSNSSGGLAAAFGLSRDSSAESLDEQFNSVCAISDNKLPRSENFPDGHKRRERNSPRRGGHVRPAKNKNVTIDERRNIHVQQEGKNNEQKNPHVQEQKVDDTASRTSDKTRDSADEMNERVIQEQQQILANRPKELQEVIAELGLLKYLPTFEEQDVDLQVFLSLTDNDLKEVGIKLFGPRRKMTNAIARWHSKARPASRDLEQAYADKLESEMQEMAIRLQQAYEQMDQLKAQVLQEKELRSVTESYLMEHRTAWDQVFRVTADTQDRCQEMNTILSQIREVQSSLNKPSSGTNDKTALDNPSEKEKAVTKLDKCCEDLDREIKIALLNTDKLLGKNPEYGSQVNGET